MNREIKFRVWDKSLNKFLITDNGTSAVEPDSDEEFLRKELFSNRKLGEKYGFISFYPDRLIYQQFTGLKDKNNKEIYEGDIIKRVHYEDSLYIVVWNEDGYYWRGTHETDKEFIEYRASPYNRDRLIDGIKNCEVIGNIMENPELLKEYEKNQTSNVA